MLRDTGRREEVRRMLAEIYGWFTEGFDTKDLEDAKVLLKFDTVAINQRVVQDVPTLQTLASFRETGLGRGTA